ncbi:MAG: ComEC/Rec2 family competence protein [Oscillospiraceae bacterium]
MVRKMAYIGTFYLIGLFFASLFNFKIDFIISGFLLIISTAFFFIFGKKVTIFVSALSLIFGMSLYGFYEMAVYLPTIKLAKTTQTISGKITDISNHDGDKSTYIISSNVNGIPTKFVLFTDTFSCDYYDEITVTGTLEGLQDTYTFPTKSYNKAKNIFLEITEPTVQKITQKFSVAREIMHYRDYLYHRIVSYLPGEEGKALVAMLFGDKAGLESDTKTVLFRSGIGHIMSVSGVHLSILAGVFIWILSKFSANKWLKFFSLESVILAFVVFAGMSPSVVRSALMITIIYGAKLFNRRADTFNSLGIAVVLLTIFSPFAVRDASFLLSVTGVFGISVAAPYVTSLIKKTGKLGDFYRQIAAMLCVTVTVFPVSFLFFDEISIISPLTNLILVPICSVALVCGIIIAFTGGISIIAFPLSIVAGFCCKIVLFFSEIIGRLSFSYIPTGYGYMKISVLISIAVMAIILLFFRTRKNIVITAFCSIFLLIVGNISYKIVNKDVLSIAVLREKSAVSVILHTNSSACILNLNASTKLSNCNKKYLRSLGISEIDVIALNSNSLQSGASYANNFDLFKVKNILIPADIFFADGTKILGVIPQKCDFSNAEINLDGYTIKLLSDDTIEIIYGDFSMLFEKEKVQEHSYSDYDLVSIYDSKNVENSYEYLFIADEKIQKNYIENSIKIRCKTTGEMQIRGIENANNQ